jgi:hypothetical protein
MTITITLPPETEQKLLDRAAHTGQDAASLARDLIERGLDAVPTIDDILTPFRREVAASGLSDAELDALFEEQRQETWKKHEGAKG